MNTFQRRSLSALVLFAVLISSAAAQTKSKDATASATAEPVSEAAQDQAAAEQAGPVKSPGKSGEPEGNGKWVPRINKSTCPNGSVAYVDETNGGVKCWVNTA